MSRFRLVLTSGLAGAAAGVLAAMLLSRREHPRQSRDQRQLPERLILGCATDEVRDFNARNHRFVQRFKHLRKAFESAFLRTLNDPSAADKAIFYIRRLCIEDFNEVLVLCANGYGFGALKLIRGMFERTVTAFFLHLHPEEASRFFDYYWVTQQKEVNNIRDNFGAEAVARIPVEEIEENYKRVSSQFRITDCKKCGTTRVNHTWHELDLVSMARDIEAHSQIKISKFIYDAYLRPLRHAHNTTASILERLKDEEEGGITFKYQFQREEADRALKTAHRLVLLIVMLQGVHFELPPIADQWGVLLKDFGEIWPDAEQVTSA